MVESEAAPTTPKKTKTTKAKKPKVAPSHPPASKMVPAAITALKERGGSSLAAIKKYIAANYKVDGEKMSFYIRKYLKSAVANGTLVQTKGVGANGSFKLSSAPKEAKKTASKPKKAASPKKKKAPSTPKKAAKKAAAKPKKAAAKPKPKKSPAKKAKPAKKPASPKKPKAVKLAVKPKKAKASPKKKPAAKKAKK